MTRPHATAPLRPRRSVAARSLLCLAVGLALASGLTGCGRKPTQLSLPAGAEPNLYPRTYPARRYAHPDPDWAEAGPAETNTNATGHGTAPAAGTDGRPPTAAASP